MKNRSVVPNATKNSKEMLNLKIIRSAIPRKNVSFVIFAVMDHILKWTLIDTS
jgi:hypothetical protein